MHVGNLAAMTGVSRFGESGNGKYRYSKEEHIEAKLMKDTEFEWLLSDEDIVDGFEVKHTVNAFSHVSFTPKRLPFVHIHTKPQV